MKSFFQHLDEVEEKLDKPSTSDIKMRYEMIKDPSSGFKIKSVEQAIDIVYDELKDVFTKVDKDQVAKVITKMYK
jgi:hypothetical protein